VCTELGPPSLLKVIEQPDPEPAAGQALVEVEASGVNFVDALFVAGKYQIKPAVPFTPGSEVAGTVVAVGPDVDAVTPGDRVFGSLGLGGFASHVVAAVDNLVQIPPGLDSPRAATFSQSYSTALFALRRRACLTAGERVLVLGAGGGVGLAAIDVAATLGSVVIGAASSEEKRAAARVAGASHTIDTTVDDVKTRTRVLTDGLGVDVVVDPVGGRLAEPALRALAFGGRYLVIGFASGEIPSVPLNQILLRNRSVLGVDWGAWAMADARSQRELLGELLKMVAEGLLSPVEPAIYPLDQVGEALENLISRQVVGKLALVP
jgi:NADPH:quinone reductase